MRQRLAKCFLKSASMRCRRYEGHLEIHHSVACKLSSRLIGLRLARRCL